MSRSLLFLRISFSLQTSFSPRHKTPHDHKNSGEQEGIARAPLAWGEAAVNTQTASFFPSSAPAELEWAGSPVLEKGGWDTVGTELRIFNQPRDLYSGRLQPLHHTEGAPANYFPCYTSTGKALCKLD